MLFLLFGEIDFGKKKHSFPVSNLVTVLHLVTLLQFIFNISQLFICSGCNIDDFLHLFPTYKHKLIYIHITPTYLLTFLYILFLNLFSRCLQTAANFARTKAVVNLEVSSFNFIICKLLIFR